LVRDAAGVGGVGDAATALLVVGPAVVDAFDARAHEQADDVVALPLEQVRRDGAIHTATHGQDDACGHRSQPRRKQTRPPGRIPPSYTDTRAAATVPRATKNGPPESGGPSKIRAAGGGYHPFLGAVGGGIGPAGAGAGTGAGAGAGLPIAPAP